MPNGVQWGMDETELQRCSVTVTIIHILEDWRGIELWLLMEFLQLWICNLKFTFAYCKMVLDVSATAVHFSPVFIEDVYHAAKPFNWSYNKGKRCAIVCCFFSSSLTDIYGFCFSCGYAKQPKPLSDCAGRVPRTMLSKNVDHCEWWHSKSIKSFLGHYKCKYVNINALAFGYLSKWVCLYGL